MTWGRWLRRSIGVYRGRFVFSVISVVLGVTAFVGVSIGVGAMSDALDLERDQQTAGVASNSLFLRPTGVWGAAAPLRTVTPIATVDGVESIKPMVWTRVRIDGEPAWVNGQTEAIGRSTSEDKLPPLGRDELVVGEELASRGVQVGDVVSVEARSDSVEMKVVDVDFRGPTIASLDTAQRLAGIGDGVTGLSVELREGEDGERWAATHASELGPFVASTTFATTDAIAFFRTLEKSVTPVASGALVMGSFLIYLTISRTVQDRQRDLAALRAVGATRGRILGLLLAEAAAIGVIGTALGLVCGLGVARGVANLMSAAFGVSIAVVPGLHAPASVIVKAIVLGLLAPVVAALVPAIRSGREDPAPLLRGAPPERAPRLAMSLLGLALFAIGVAITAGVATALKPLGNMVALIGIVLSGPGLALTVGALLQRMYRRVSARGELAAQRVSRRPGRSARTAALLATTLATVVILLTIGASGRVGFVRMVEANTRADVELVANGNLPIERSLISRVDRSSEDAAVSEGANGSVFVLDDGGREEYLTVIDPATYFDIATFAWTPDSTQESARRALSTPHHVLLATAIANRIDKQVGDTIRLQTQDGPEEFVVGGIYAGMGWGWTHAVITSVGDAKQYFGYDAPTHVWIRSVAPLSFRDDDVSVIVNALQRSEFIAGFDSAWSLVALTGIIAAGIGLMGLVNTMIMEVVDRRHEIGVLRTVGAHRSDIKRLVSLEALTFGVMAGIVGLVTGSIIGRASATGIAIDTEQPQVFRYPFTALPLVLVLAVVAGLVAGRIPARRAARVDPAEVLRSL